MPDSIVPVPLTSDNALGEGYPNQADISTWVDGVSTFFEGAWEGIKNESIVGKVVNSVNKGVDAIGSTLSAAGSGLSSTLKILPVLIAVIIAGLVAYLFLMGKKGKAIA